MTTLTAAQSGQGQPGTVQSGQVQPGQGQPGPVQPGPVPALHGDEAEDIVQRSCLDIFCCCFSGRNVSEADDRAVIFDAGGGTGGRAARIVGIDNPNQESEEDNAPHGAGGAAANVEGAAGGDTAGPSTEGPQVVKRKVPAMQRPGMKYLTQISDVKQEVENANKILLFCYNTLKGLMQLEGMEFIDGIEREGRQETKVKERKIIDGKAQKVTTTLRAGGFVQLMDLLDALREIYPKKSEVYRLATSVPNENLVEPFDRFYLRDFINDDEFNVGVEQGQVMLFVRKYIHSANKSDDPVNEMKALVTSLKEVLKQVLFSIKHLQNTVETDVERLKESEGQK